MLNGAREWRHERRFAFSAQIKLPTRNHKPRSIIYLRRRRGMESAIPVGNFELPSPRNPDRSFRKRTARGFAAGGAANRLKVGSPAPPAALGACFGAARGLRRPRGERSGAGDQAARPRHRASSVRSTLGRTRSMKKLRRPRGARRPCRASTRRARAAHSNDALEPPEPFGSTPRARVTNGRSLTTTPFASPTPIPTRAAVECGPPDVGDVLGDQSGVY